MNLGDLKEAFRWTTRDVEGELLWKDSQLVAWANEAQDQAALRSPLLKTSDLGLGETASKATITIAGTSGTITAVTIGQMNIIVNPVTWTTDNNTTAQLLANEINTQNFVTATVASNVLTLTPLAGNGAGYNNLIPVVNSSVPLSTATAFVGGVDGICRITIKPNQTVYSFSPKICKIENFYIPNGPRTPRLVDYRLLHDSQRYEFNKQGRVEVIIYGESTTSFRVGYTPKFNEVIQMTVFYRPLTRMVKDTDTPEIPEQFHSRLVDYMLYKAYNTVDSEADHTDLSDRYLSIFEKEFNDGMMSDAAVQFNPSFFFGDRSTWNNFVNNWD